jgi:hypothetical protein
VSYSIRPDIAEVVAGLPGVHKEVIATAHKGAKILRKKIAKDTGAMARSVRVEVLAKDAFFGIGDDGAIGYNFGHLNNWSGEPVTGSHVIERTIAEMG